MDKFLETCNLPKLNQEAAESLNSLITTSGIEGVIKQLQAHKSHGLDGFIGKFYQTFKDELTPILVKLFQKFKVEEDSRNHFMRPAFSNSKPYKDTTKNKIISQYT